VINLEIEISTTYFVNTPDFCVNGVKEHRSFSEAGSKSGRSKPDLPAKRANHSPAINGRVYGYKEIVVKAVNGLFCFYPVIHLCPGMKHMAYGSFLKLAAMDTRRRLKPEKTNNRIYICGMIWLVKNLFPQHSNTFVLLSVVFFFLPHQG